MGYPKNWLPSRSKGAGLLNAVFGGLLVTLPAIPAIVADSAFAQTPAINPCPGIYYEEPFSNTYRVPAGCPPNAATLREAGQDPNAAQTEVTPAPQTQQTPTVPQQSPLPESILPPSGFVSIPNGTLNIELVNNTNTEVTYEVLGQTDQRSLSGRSQVSLQGLRTPINMTFVRPDGGFVTVTPRAVSPGVLEVTLVEAPDVDAGQGAMNVQGNGNFYLN